MVEFSNLGQYNTIVGSNNSGKTNLFRAISFIGEAIRNPTLDFQPYYHDGNLEKGFDVELGLVLDSEEIEALANFMICSTLSQLPNLSQGENPTAFYELQPILATAHKHLFEQMFSGLLSIRVTGTGKQGYPSQIFLQVGVEDSKLYIMNFSMISLAQPPFSATAITHFAQLFLDRLRSVHAKETTDFLTGKSRELLRILQNSLISDLRTLIGELKGHADNKGLSINIIGFTFTQLETQLFQLQPVEPTLIRLRNFLSRRGRISQGPNLKEMFQAIFDSSIIRIEDVRSKPVGFLPIDFDSISSQKEVLTGSDLALVLFKLKNSPAQSDKDRYKGIQDTFSKIMRDVKFDIVLRTRPITQQAQAELGFVPADKLGLQPQLSWPARTENLSFLVARSGERELKATEVNIHLSTGKHSVPIDFGAAGAFEILYVLTAFSGLQNKVVLLDEPAQNLHPTMQAKLNQEINDAGKMNANQIFVITHSPYLIKTDNLRNTWRLSRGPNGSRIYNVEGILESIVGAQAVKKSQTRWFPYPEVKSLLFAQGAILVEGPSDKLVIQIVDKYLSAKNNEPRIDEYEWQIVDVGGKDTFGNFIALLNSFGMPYVVVADYDALMCCDTSTHLDGCEMRTSAVIKALLINNLVLKEEVALLKEKKIELIVADSKQQYWYAQSSFTELSCFSRAHNIFVFSSDLEGALQSSNAPRAHKPFEAIQTVTERIEQETLNETEFTSLLEFIKKRAV